MQFIELAQMKIYKCEKGMDDTQCHATEMLQQRACSTINLPRIRTNQKMFWTPTLSELGNVTRMSHPQQKRTKDWEQKIRSQNYAIPRLFEEQFSFTSEKWTEVPIRQANYGYN